MPRKTIKGLEEMLSAAKAYLKEAREDIERLKIKHSAEVADLEQTILNLRREGKFNAQMVEDLLPTLDRAGHPVKASIPGGTIRGLADAVESIIREKHRLVSEYDAQLAKVDRQKNDAVELAGAQTSAVASVAVNTASEKDVEIVELRIEVAKQQALINFLKTRVYE